jgi:hypothetical protein
MKVGGTSYPAASMSHKEGHRFSQKLFLFGQNSLFQLC